MDIYGARTDIAKKMKELIDAKRNKDGTAVSAAFIKDGELIAAFACGTQDGNAENPATIHDLYGIGSVAKVYCAMAVMKLCEMGKIGLDTPVTEYLPQFRMKDERYKQITLRMCLNHSSGLPDANIKNSYSSKWAYKNIYDQYYDFFAKSKLKANPGYCSVYNNDGFTLAEMVVAEVSKMSFTQFIQQYIAKPAGAISTCSGENNPESRVLIKERGKTAEYLMCIGSGGVFTDLIDCAKIGYLFIDPKGILMPETISEIARLQGKSFITDILGESCGLGWDFINYKDEHYDFGDEVLVKGGTTSSFSSTLLVIKKYNLAAAISLTHDNCLSALPLLCELSNMLLDDYNIDTGKELNNSVRETKKRPVPAEFSDRYTGVYYNNYELYNVSFDFDSCTVQKMKPDGWSTVINNASFDGQRFLSDSIPFSFDEHKGKSYMIQEMPPWGTNAVQKHECFPPLNDAWKKRIGKKYIVCDANTFDITLTLAMIAITIQDFGQEGILFFVLKPGLGTMLTMPVIPYGEKETEMIVDAPGLLGSRLGFAPFVYDKEGIGYLYAYGYNLIDTTYLKPLQSGQVISDKDGQNRVFSITAGKKLIIDIPADIRVILLNTDLSIWYDSSSGQELTETCDGFILFISDTPMNISVEVC